MRTCTCNRYIVKEVKADEATDFGKLAPTYFEHISDVLFRRCAAASHERLPPGVGSRVKG